jgi:hypothetical protein
MLQLHQAVMRIWVKTELAYDTGHKCSETKYVLHTLYWTIIQTNTAHDLNVASMVLKVHCHYRHDQPLRSWHRERSLDYTSTSSSTTNNTFKTLPAFKILYFIPHWTYNTSEGSQNTVKVKSRRIYLLSSKYIFLDVTASTKFLPVHTHYTDF